MVIYVAENCATMIKNGFSLVALILPSKCKLISAVSQNRFLAYVAAGPRFLSKLKTLLRLAKAIRANNQHRVTKQQNISGFQNRYLPAPAVVRDASR